MVPALGTLCENGAMEVQAALDTSQPCRGAQRGQQSSPSLSLAESGFKLTVLTRNLREVPECWEWQASNRPLCGIIRASPVGTLPHRDGKELRGLVESPRITLHGRAAKNRRLGSPGHPPPQGSQLNPIYPHWWDSQH